MSRGRVNGASPALFLWSVGPAGLKQARRRDTLRRVPNRLPIFALLCTCACSSAGDTEGPSQLGPGQTSQPGDMSPHTSLPGNDPIIIDGPAIPAVGPDTSPRPGTDPGDCDNVLEVTYRDFKESHVDFEGAFAGDEVRLGLVEPELGPDGKPVFRSSIGCPWAADDPTQCNPDWLPEEKAIDSRESFDQWYRTSDGVNIEFNKTLILTERPVGSGLFVFESDEFFPLSADEGFGATPQNGQGRNYLFTTEIHLVFTYVKGQTFRFRGDDDLWIFVNNKLALDLGSMHNPAEGVIDFDASADRLGISPNGSYRMDVFHAERHTHVSSFRVETNIGCFRPAPAPVR